MDIEIKPKIDKAVGALTDAEKKQIPFATAIAMNRTAFTVRTAMQKAMPSYFDRPTQMTIDAVLYDKTTKRDNNIVSRIFLRDEASKGTAPVRYLFPEVEGGQRNETRFERALRFAGRLPAGMSVVPGKGVTLDQYGNVPNGIANQALSQVHGQIDPSQNTTKRSAAKAKGKRASYFMGRPGGGRLPLGIYQRMAHGVRPIYVFVPKRPAYRTRFPFYQIVQGAFDKLYPIEFKKAFKEAMATARR